jgi:hypothetical protein
VVRALARARDDGHHTTRAEERGMRRTVMAMTRRTAAVAEGGVDRGYLPRV